VIALGSALERASTNSRWCLLTSEWRLNSTRRRWWWSHVK